jgi:hypothetical protein
VSQYFLETPAGSVELLAPDDLTACAKAREWFARHGFHQTGYNLFRAPLYYVERATAGLIWIPLFRFL